MAITKRDIERALDNFDLDAREWYLSMDPEERQVVLLSMSASNSSRLAILEKRQIDFEADARQYRQKREKRENGDDEDAVSITQKILKAIGEAEAKKFNYAMWFRDRVLPTLVTGFILALLYLVYGGKLP